MADAHVTHERLVALHAGELPDAEAAAIDEHLFACDACAAAAERLGELVAGLRAVVPDFISPAVRDRMIAGGARLVLNPVAAGGRSDAHIPADVDAVVHVLRAELAGAARAELEFLAPDGTLLIRHEHVPFDPATGEVMIACRHHFRGMFPDDAWFRVYAVRGAERRPAGDFRVHHTWAAE